LFYIRIWKQQYETPENVKRDDSHLAYVKRMRETGDRFGGMSSPEDDIVIPCSESRFAETIALLQDRVHCSDTGRARQRIADAVVRGAAAGIGLRGGLHLVSYIVNLMTSKGRKRRPSGNGVPTSKDLLLDTLRWGAFLGCFSGAFVFGDEIIALLGGRKRTRAWRAMVAGAAAGPSLLLTGPGSNHTSLAIYILLRGTTLLVRCGNLPTAAPWKRRMLAPTRWRHGDVAIMCVSATQLLYSWIVMPSTLPLSYVRFLNKHGGINLNLLDAFREMCSRADEYGLYGGVSLAALRGTLHENFTGSMPCDIIHPGKTCTVHALTFFPEAYLRALPVYLPVYAIPAALVHRGKLLAPETRNELWLKMALGALRSSAFLALYCTLAWRGVCTGFHIAGGASGRVVAASVWLAGLAVLLEKKSRRMELALYCLSRAVEAFTLAAVTWGWLPLRTRSGWMAHIRLDVVLFSAAAAAICHCYSDHDGARRCVFRSKYLTVFDFIFGNTGFEGSKIAHVPSNVELFSLATRRLETSARHLAQSAGNLTGLVTDRASSTEEISGNGNNKGNGGEEGGHKVDERGEEVDGPRNNIGMDEDMQGKEG